MTKQKVGLVLFGIGVAYIIAWEILNNVAIVPLMRSLTTEELNQTIWAFTGPLMTLRGISMPLGAIVAAIGILLYSRAKGATVWKVGIGLFIVLIVSLVAMGFNYYSAPVFGIGGSLILLSFIGILWLLGKERMALKGSSTTALDFKLVGYVFMLMAAFYIWAKASDGFLKVTEGLPPMSMMNILILLTAGWIFLFLSHYKSRKQQG